MQVQDLALGLVETHEVHTGPILELVQVPLDGFASFQFQPMIVICIYEVELIFLKKQMARNHVFSFSSCQHV